jgi:hypothetical protein
VKKNMLGAFLCSLTAKGAVYSQNFQLEQQTVKNVLKIKKVAHAIKDLGSYHYKCEICPLAQNSFEILENSVAVFNLENGGKRVEFMVQEESGKKKNWQISVQSMFKSSELAEENFEDLKQKPTTPIQIKSKPYDLAKIIYQGDSGIKITAQGRILSSAALGELVNVEIITQQGNSPSKKLKGKLISLNEVVIEN